VKPLTLVEFKKATTVPRGGGIETALLISKDLGASNIMSGITTLPSGGALRTHSHNVEEMITLLEGKVVLEAQGRRLELTQYDTCLVPPGAFHSLQNPGDTVCRILWVYGSVQVTRTFARTSGTTSLLQPEAPGP